MEILKLNQGNYREVFQKAVAAVKKGEVLVCPTDTVYGLLCDAANKKAVKKLFKIKKRSKNKPIPIFVRDIKMAKKLAKINSQQEKFLRKIWPGPVTVVLPIKGKKGTIGIRIPKHKWLLNLVKQLGCPLAESSANISGKPASTRIKEVLKQFTLRRGSGQGNQKYQPDLVIDVGDLRESKSSKVIDLTIWPPKILRI